MKLLLKARDVWIEAEDKIILKEVNLEISEGEFLWLEGKTGAGKSRLLKVLSFGENSSNGDIVSVKKFPLFTENATLLQNDSVKENLKSAAPLAGTLDTSELLNALGLFEKRNQKTCSLSAGEKMLLKLATFLILETELVFLDEPFGRMDAETKLQAFKTILEKNRKNTAVLIASTFPCPEDSPVKTRKLTLKDGKLYEK
ncbi:MAG: ATP-binding cassette domain-containing protein [bacterium]